MKFVRYNRERLCSKSTFWDQKLELNLFVKKLEFDLIVIVITEFEFRLVSCFSFKVENE
jgi:hypothetical protein